MKKEVLNFFLNFELVQGGGGKTALKSELVKGMLCSCCVTDAHTHPHGLLSPLKKKEKRKIQHSRQFSAFQENATVVLVCTHFDKESSVERRQRAATA